MSSRWAGNRARKGCRWVTGNYRRAWVACHITFLELLYELNISCTDVAANSEDFQFRIIKPHHLPTGSRKMRVM